MNCYYVYFLLDPRRYYLPFYVGKGKGDRAYSHLYNLTIKCNSFKNHVIGKIRSAGLEPKVLIWAKDLCENDAYELEEQLIKRFGKRNDKSGILTNIRYISRSRPANQTNESNIKRREANIKAGRKPPVRTGPMSEEQKRKIGEGNRGKKRSKEYSQYLSDRQKGSKRNSPSEETKEKLRQSNIGKVKRKWTAEEKEAHSLRIKQQWENPERREKQSKAFDRRRNKTTKK